MNNDQNTPIPALPAPFNSGTMLFTPVRVYWSDVVKDWCVEAVATDLVDGINHGTYTAPRYGRKGNTTPWHTRLSWYSGSGKDNPCE